MENFKIPATKYTLEVNLDAAAGTLEMSGSSYPENAIDFFQPIFDWIKMYLAEAPPKVILKLKINYLNTSSAKCILDILETLEQYYKEKNRDVSVNWYYAKDDEDILEMGEEIAEDSEIPFNLLSF